MIGVDEYIKVSKQVVDSEGNKAWHDMQIARRNSKVTGSIVIGREGSGAHSGAIKVYRIEGTLPEPRVLSVSNRKSEDSSARKPLPAAPRRKPTASVPVIRNPARKSQGSPSVLKSRSKMRK